MQDEETECRRRNCFKGLLLQNPARLQHWEEMDLGYDIKCSEHESREVQNKVFVHGINFQYHITGENMGILSPWATLGWEREGASLLQPCSDPAQGKPCCSPPTLCRVQGGCTSDVHSLKQTVQTGCPVPETSSWQDSQVRDGPVRRGNVIPQRISSQRSRKGLGPFPNVCSPKLWANAQAETSSSCV